jgi:adhesin transport system outer membrane protein
MIQIDLVLGRFRLVARNSRTAATSALGCLGIAAQLCALPAQALTLEESVAQAILIDPQLKQTYSRMKSTESDKAFSEGDFFPTLTLSGGAGTERTDYSSGSKIDDEAKKTELALILRQPLFSGLSTYNDVKRIGYEVEAERLKLYSEAEGVSIRVIEVYLNLLAAQQILELSKRNQEDHEKILDDVKTKVNNQLAARSDLAQVESRLANARASRVAAKNRVMDLGSEFMLLVGLQASDLIEPVPNSLELPETEDEAVNSAKLNHYAILSAIQDVNATDREYASASGDYYPEVYLEISSNQDKYWDDGNGNPNTGKSSDTGIMLKMEYELFSGGKRYARRSASRWRHQESIELKQATERDVVQQVHQTWSAYKYLAEQVYFLQINVDNSALAEAGYREQFKVGRRELLDVLIAKTDLFQARKSYLETHFQQLTATYKLKYVTGRLMPALSIEFPRQWKESGHE